MQLGPDLDNSRARHRATEQPGIVPFRCCRSHEARIACGYSPRCIGSSQGCKVGGGRRPVGQRRRLRQEQQDDHDNHDHRAQTGREDST
jgi:hypothetical protein